MKIIKPSLFILLLCSFIFNSSYVFSQNKTVAKDSTILTIVEVMPEYPGGQDAMYDYIANNVQYPQFAKEKNITGTVIIQFIVEKDGSISNVKILKSIGGGCDEEAERVIKSMPKWKAGMQKGQPVRVQFNLPIRFTLN